MALRDAPVSQSGSVGVGTESVPPHDFLQPRAMGNRQAGVKRTPCKACLRACLGCDRRRPYLGMIVLENSGTLRSIQPASSGYTGGKTNHDHICRQDLGPLFVEVRTT